MKEYVVMLITNTKTKTNLLGAGNKLSDNIVGYNFVSDNLLPPTRRL